MSAFRRLKCSDCSQLHRVSIMTMIIRHLKLKSKSCQEFGAHHIFKECEENAGHTPRMGDLKNALERACKSAQRLIQNNLYTAEGGQSIFEVLTEHYKNQRKKGKRRTGLPSQYFHRVQNSWSRPVNFRNGHPDSQHMHLNAIENDKYLSAPSRHERASGSQKWKKIWKCRHDQSILRLFTTSTRRFPEDLTVELQQRTARPEHPRSARCSRCGRPTWSFQGSPPYQILAMKHENLGESFCLRYVIRS